MKKLLGCIAAAVLALSPALAAAEGKVPAGKETLTLDSMTKAKQAMTPAKKVLKGPVPFAHQAHVDKGVACTDCHHKEKAGETPKPCSDVPQGHQGGRPEARATPSTAARTSDARRCSPASAATRARSPERKPPTPRSQRKPCEACHSILKK